MSKNVAVNVRCTSEQKSIIEKRAEKANMKISEYVLKSALNKRTRISSVSKDMSRTIVQLQACLNQASVDLEKVKEGYSSDIGEAVKSLVEVQEGVDELWRLLK